MGEAHFRGVLSSYPEAQEIFLVEGGWVGVRHSSSELDIFPDLNCQRGVKSDGP